MNSDGVHTRCFMLLLMSADSFKSIKEKCSTVVNTFLEPMCLQRLVHCSRKL